MPMYDYACPHCEETFEDLRPIAERATASCPKCGKTAVKQISGFFTRSSNANPGGSCSTGGGRGGFGGG